MRNLLFFIFSAVVLIGTAVESEKSKSIIEANAKGGNMKIKIIMNNSVFTATMYDNPTAKDFISLLPLTLKLEDYAATEKVSTLPRKLSLQGAPSGSDPSIGDITYYAPWGNLAIFYNDFGYAQGLVILGRLDKNVAQLRDYSGKITIELIQ